MSEQSIGSGSGPHQAELPFAIVSGEPLTMIPRDLYIPPDALEIILEAFEGPLDLLLYLIRRQNLDILDIPIAEITRQYMGYIEMMKGSRLDLVGDYLLMAATLAEIKSRLLLPPVEGASGEEDGDPRAELVRRLQEYERYKQAAEDLDALPRPGRDRWHLNVQVAGRQVIRIDPEVSFSSLLDSFSSVMKRAELTVGHRIARQPISLRERMSDLVARLRAAPSTLFAALCSAQDGRLGIVVNFLAVLELARIGFARLTQTQAFGPIHVESQGLVLGEGNGNDELNFSVDSFPNSHDEND